MPKKGKNKGPRAKVSPVTSSYYTRSSFLKSARELSPSPSAHSTTLNEDLELSETSDTDSSTSSLPASPLPPNPSKKLCHLPPTTPSIPSLDGSPPPPPPASSPAGPSGSPVHQATSSSRDASSYAACDQPPRDLRVICTCAPEHADKLHALSPAVRARAIFQLVGDIDELKILPSGDLLLICKSMNQVNILLGLSQFAGITVRFYSPSSTPRRFYGVISDVPLEASEEDLQEIRATGATDYLRLRRRDSSGCLVGTTSLRLTFSSPPPQVVLLNYVRTPIRPFVQRLLQCYNCECYGHGATSCRSKRRCGHCAAEDHSSADCTSSTKLCALCSGPHPAWSSQCTHRQRELDFERRRSATGLPYREAKIQLRNLTPPSADPNANTINEPQKPSSLSSAPSNTAAAVDISATPAKPPPSSNCLDNMRHCYNQSTSSNSRILN